MVVGKQVRCTTCKAKSGITKCWQWIHTPCNSNKGHDLRTTHGLTYCQKCGFWDKHGGNKGRGLQGPCKPKEVPPFRKKILHRLNLPEPQPPMGTTWPDGTPSGIRRKTAAGSHSTPQATQTKAPSAEVVYRPLPALQSLRERIRAKQAERETHTKTGQVAVPHKMVLLAPQRESERM